MDLSKIISIAGKPGLYQILSQSRGGVIVASLDNGKKMAVGQTQRVSALGDISMYTMDGDMPLSEIMERVYKHTQGAALDVDTTNDKAVRGFFTEVLPEHDAERVYNSDIRKFIKWYNALLQKGLLIPESETPEVEATEVKADEAQGVSAPEAPVQAEEAPEEEAASAQEADQATGAEVDDTEEEKPDPGSK